MTKEEFLEDIKAGLVTGSEEYDFEDDDWHQNQPEQWFLYSMVYDRDDLRYDGKPIEMLEFTIPKRNYTDQDIDGRPVKLVWKIDDAVFIAEGEYDSWEGEHFPNGFHEAELVNVPTWVAKS